MNKTEAAEILANYISVRATRRNVDDTELTSTFIAECISEARYEKVEGTYLNVAGWTRPSDRTIRSTYRRNSGL